MLIQLHHHLVEDEDSLVNSTNQLPTGDMRTSNQERGNLTSSLALHNDQVLLGSMTHSIDLETNAGSSGDDHDNEVGGGWEFVYIIFKLFFKFDKTNIKARVIINQDVKLPKKDVEYLSVMLSVI